VLLLQLISGIAQGCIYGLIALGFALPIRHGNRQFRRVT
jgi:branched-subunit amino acid ABC-type transport system permease component